MRWLVLAALAGCGSVVDAAPTARACAPSDGPVRWVIERGSAIACFPDGDAEHCFRIAPGGDPRPVARPPVQAPPRRSAGEYREVGGVPSACVGSRCTKLGRRAAAAVAQVKDEGFYGASFSVTGDGRVLVIEEGGTRSAWRIDRDKQLDLVPPKERHPGSTFGLMSIQVASGRMIATWQDCAGPCGLSTLVDSNGKNVGTWFGAGIAAGLDAGRIAILPTDEGARFLVIDAQTGAWLGSNPAVGGFQVQTPAVLVDHSLLALWIGQGRDKRPVWEFHVITAPVGKPVRLGKAIQLPWCAS